MNAHLAQRWRRVLGSGNAHGFCRCSRRAGQFLTRSAVTAYAPRVCTVAVPTMEDARRPITEHPPPGPTAERSRGCSIHQRPSALKSAHAPDAERALGAAPPADEVFDLAESLWRAESVRRREEFGKAPFAGSASTRRRQRTHCSGAITSRWPPDAAAWPNCSNERTQFSRRSRMLTRPSRHRVNKTWSRETFKAWCWRQTR